MRRAAIVLLSACMPLALVACEREGDAARRAASAPPRVLLVTWETTRADHVGAYGAKQARTPAFDALAARGLLYEHAYAAAPITLPSHATLLTGVLPQSHGVRDNGQFQVAPAARLLSEAFADAGCATGAFVGAYVLDPRFGLAQGFATYDAPDSAAVGTQFGMVERTADAVAAPALRFIDGLAADARFFLWLHFYDPHHPHVGSYDAEIAACDLQLQRVLERLAARGLDRGLVTVVTADHGESLHEHREETHGIFVYDATMRVPLVVSPAPEGIAPGTRIAAPVSLADVAATLLERCGLGRALLPDAHGPLLPTSDAAADPERPLLLESFTPYFSHRWFPLRAIVWKGMKLIDAPRRELYDLAADPGETSDRYAADPERGERMAQRLRALVAEQPRLAWEQRERPAPDVVAKLQALGYVSAADGNGDEADFAGLPDPKERIGDLDLKDQVVALVRDGSEKLGRDRAGALKLFARARALVATLRANHAKDPAVDSLAATVELAEGDHAAAREPLERITAAEPRESRHHHNLAVCYWATGELELGRREMEKALSLDPHALLSLRWIVQFHRDRRDAASAAWWLDQLQNCPGQTPAELAEVRQLLASVQQNLAEQHEVPRAPLPVANDELLPERWLMKARAQKEPEKKQSKGATSPRRVLLVTLDTTRADRLGSYGRAAARTPFLDGVAREGVRFSHAWCAAPITLPSHATILTAAWPSAHGVRDNGLFVLSDAATLLPEVLRKEGFATGAFVGSFILDARFGLAQGFDVYHGPPPSALGVKPEVVQRPAAQVVDDALGWFDGLADDASFFAWLHFYDPHAPHQAPTPAAASGPPLTDAYDAEIAECDAQLARLRQRLERRGFTNGLLEVVTADHGEGLGEHGEETHGLLLHDATMRVPLLVRGAGAAAGLVVDAPVGNAQIAPTVLAWLGIDANALPEASVAALPLTAADDDAPPLPLETFLPFHLHRWQPLQAIVWRGRKLVHGTFDELFDLAADPGETKDLAGAQPELVKALAQRLEALIAGEKKLPAARGPELSADERTALRALGYTGASSAGGSPESGSGASGAELLDDPRTQIDSERDQQRAFELLTQARGLLGQDAALAQNGAPAANPAQRDRALALLDDARAQLQALAQKHPRDPSVAFDLGNVELSSGRPADAAPCFERALLADPQSSQGHYNLAVAYAGAGQAAFAIAEMEKAVACEPRFVRAWKWLIATHEVGGEFGRAAWWVERLAESGALADSEQAPLRAKREQLKARLQAAGQELAPSPTFPPTDFRPERLRH